MSDSGQDDCCCDQMCVLCQMPINLQKDCYEMYDDEYYCGSQCLSVHVKEELNSKTLEEIDGMFWGDNDQLYEWIYGEEIDNAVETIGNWWFIQRKKMLKKPTKSANKTM